MKSVHPMTFDFDVPQSFAEWERQSQDPPPRVPPGLRALARHVIHSVGAWRGAASTARRRRVRIARA